MPIVTMTVRKPKIAEFKTRILGAVHAALVNAGVNPNDRFHRLIEFDESDFQYDAAFPDVRTRRTSDFVLVEVLLGSARNWRLPNPALNRTGRHAVRFSLASARPAG